MTSRMQVQHTQRGEGWKDTIISGVNRLSNLVPSSDENARDVFPGEMHGIVKTDEGKFGRANWEGPGTEVVRRLKRKPDGSKQFPWVAGDPPRNSNSDLISRAHDLRYTLARDSTAIRQADEKMLKDLKKARKRGAPRFNILPAQAGIAAKVKAEDWNLADKNKFVSDVPVSGADRALVESELEEMEKRGFGRPGEKLLRQLNRAKKRGRRRRK